MTIHSIELAYVGKEKQHEDRLFKTGVWFRGDQRSVQIDTAQRMLMHPMVWKEASKVAAEKAEAAKAEETRIEAGALPFDITQFNVKNATTKIQEDEISDADLVGLLEAEKVNPNGARKTVIAAIDEELSARAGNDE